MIQEYQYVYEVYKERSFTKAARNLFISQPSLSASIRKIETQQGYKIFNRNSSKLQLTQEGEYYIQTAEKILNAEKELATYISELSNLEIGEITVSGTALFSSCVIPEIIKTFSALYPKITLHFMEADSLLLYQRALEDQVDLIIDGGQMNSELFEKTFLFHEHILLAVPMHDPIVNIYHLLDQALSLNDILQGRHLQKDCPSIDLSLLQNETLLLLQAGHDMHTRSLQLCEDYGFTPKNSIYLNQLMTAFHMACKGLGSTFITDTLVKHSNITAPMLYFKLNPGNPALIQRDVFIAHRKNCHVTHAMEKFIKTCHQLTIFD